jgi:hypothetical protein
LTARQGFCALVEKDWGAFGHIFERRLGAGARRAPADVRERAPIFEQFLDAVWQLTAQHPSAFEVRVDGRRRTGTAMKMRSRCDSSSSLVAVARAGDRRR